MSGVPNPEPATEPKRWQRQFVSIDCLSNAEITVEPPEGPYPALITFEFNGGTIMAVDAQALASLLDMAATHARKLTRESRQS